MAWLTQTDLELALTEQMLINFTSDQASPSSVDTDVVNHVINMAVAEVKASLKQRYSSQCSNETSDYLVTELCLCLAVRKLFARRPAFGIPQDWMDRIDRAQAILTNLQQGIMSVPAWTEDDIIEVGEQEYPPDDENYTWDEWEAEREEADF